MAEAILIQKDMLIRDLIEKFPDAALVLQEHGLQCLGCSVNVMETIEQGAKVHGMPETEIDKMLEKANKVAKNAPVKEAKTVDYTTMDVVFTDKAIAKVKEFKEKAEEDPGDFFRVGVQPGGCSGMSYFMTFEKEKSDDDIVFDKGGVSVIVDKKSLEALDGVQVDFVETLNESGFKFENPNARRTCGCGSSFR